MSGLPDFDQQSITRELLALKARIRDLEQRSPYAGTGMSPNGADGVQVDGDLIIEGAGTVGGTWMSSEFDGDLATAAPGTTGWAFDDARAILPELVLRPGSIGNDSLTEPVRATRLHDDAQNFAVTPTYATVLTAAVTIPDGYTQALIMTAATGVTAYNDTAGVDFLLCRTRLNGGSMDGWVIGSVDIDSTGTGVAYQFNSGLATGLTPGGTLTFTGQVASSFGSWSAINANVANLDVALLWLR